VFVLVCLPVLMWICLSFRGASSSESFSYIDYIRVFYPHHFLIESAKSYQLIGFLIMGYCGVIAAWMLPNQRRFWLTCLGSGGVLLFVGATLPYLINHRIVFNLHLLRADGVTQFIIFTIMVCASIRVWSLQSEPPLLRVLALTTTAALVSLNAKPGYLLVCAASLSLMVIAKLKSSRAATPCREYLTLALGHPILGWSMVLVLVGVEFWYSGVVWWSVARVTLFLTAVGLVIKDRPMIKTTLPAIFTVLVALVMLTSWIAWDKQNTESTMRQRQDQPFNEIVSWVRQNVDKGPWLLPLGEQFDRFQWLTRQTVWVDQRQGAAVMWEPSFYEQWMSRYLAVKTLNSDDAFVAYAIERHISHLILKRPDGTCPYPARALFANAQYIVCFLPED
jgi:hypothetical protein